MSSLPGARGTVGGGKGEYQGEGHNGEKGRVPDGMTANTYSPSMLLEVVDII